MMVGFKDEKGVNQVFIGTPSNQKRADFRIQKIVRELRSPQRILELGCGHGDLTEELLKNGHQVVAIDQSQQMLDITSARCTSYQGLRLVQSEILDFLSESSQHGEQYEAIVGMGILHHLSPSLDQILKSLGSVMTSEGKCLFWEPNAKNPIVKLIFFTALGRRLMSLDPQEQAFTQKEIGAQLEAAGLEFSIAEKDWIYPFTPIFMQDSIRALELRCPKFFNGFIAQSLWISFNKKS